MNNSNTGLAEHLLTHFATEKVVERTHTCMQMSAGKYLSCTEEGEEQRAPRAPVVGFSHRCSCTKRLRLLLLLGVRMKIISLLCRYVLKLVSHPTRGSYVLIKEKRRQVMKAPSIRNDLHKARLRRLPTKSSGVQTESSYTVRC